MKTHIPALDGLRALAALMVMWFHFFQNPLNIPEGAIGELIGKVNNLGQTGVDLFFVLSGFLITRILLRDKSKPYYFRNFYIKRSLRIFPLYYFFLLFALFVNPLLLGRSIPQFSDYWWWFAYLQNVPFTFDGSLVGADRYCADTIGHYWSLAIEEHFYMVWPLLVFVLRHRGLMVASVSMVVLSFALRFFLESNGWESFYFTLTRLDALSMGTILALVEPALRSRAEIVRKVLPVAMVALSLPLVVAFAMFSGDSVFVVQLIKFPLIAAFYCLFMAYIVISPDHSRTARIFSNRVGLYLGGISYGLYVYHGTCFRWFDRIFPDAPTFISLPCAFAFAIIVAHLSFKLFEAPIMRLKKRFVKDGSNQSPQVAGASAVPQV